MKSVKSVKFLAFNRRVLNAALASAVVLAGTGLVGNTYAGEATGATSAAVIVPISVTNNTTLDFGKFTNVANSITVTPANNRTATTTNTLLSGSPSVAGQVTVDGEAGATYTISFTPGNLTGPVGATAMVLSNMTAAASTATGTAITTGTVQAGGSQILKIGGTLAVNAAQTAGAYTGAYTVTVNYN